MTDPAHKPVRFYGECDCVSPDNLPDGNRSREPLRRSQSSRLGETRLSQNGVTATVSVSVMITPRLLAEWYAEMSDEQQAQFFIDLADLLVRDG